MDQFERDIKVMTVYVGADVTREHHDLWKQQIYYQNGKVNDIFKAYLFGYSNAKHKYQTS
jgi:hypothetical protein